VITESFGKIQQCSASDTWQLFAAVSLQSKNRITRAYGPTMGQHT